MIKAIFAKTAVENRYFLLDKAYELVLNGAMRGEVRKNRYCRHDPQLPLGVAGLCCTVSLCALWAPRSASEM